MTAPVVPVPSITFTAPCVCGLPARWRETYRRENGRELLHITIECRCGVDAIVGRTA